jgi:hypothetical protein
MIKNLVSSIPYSARLWLSWNKIHHAGSGKVELKELKLTGPVLQDCLALEVSGNILLDLTKHFLVLIPKPYIIKFEWNNITFQDLKEVKIDTGFLLDGDLGLLNNLKNDDKILIDCSGHHTNDEAKGRYKISFSAILCNKTEEPYNFFK